MTTSLVTGGAGFIGSHIVEALAARGDTVRVFDNFSTGTEENLAGVNGKVEIISGDVRDQAELKMAVKGVDTIFHEAAYVSAPQSLQEPQKCFDVNVSGTANLLEAARQERVKKVVLASSAAVYGQAESIPLKETLPLSPLSPYAMSKQTNEVFADLYTRVYDLPVVALRYFNVYGPRQSPDSDYAAAIPIFVRRILDGKTPVIYGDGEQWRDFIYVEDAVRANLLAAEHPSTAGNVYNVSTGEPTSILNLLYALAEIFPNALAPEFDPARAGDIYRSLGAPGMLFEAVGFEAKTSLIDGLRQTVEWMKA